MDSLHKEPSAGSSTGEVAADDERAHQGYREISDRPRHYGASLSGRNATIRTESSRRKPSKGGRLRDSHG